MKHGVSEALLASGRKQAELWGITLGGEELEALALYAETLSSYEKANVVGTREIERLWRDHVLDSLSCLLCHPLRGSRSLVDVGTGGGMPGIPLHLAVDFERLCLLESTGKKISFLRYAVERLRVRKVETANGRAEELGKESGYRESFEAATVRAVAPLAVICEYCLPFLEVGGAMVAMKGGIDGEEYGAGERAAQELGGEVEEIIRVPLLPEFEQKERHLIVVGKVRRTPYRYPRETGTPRKSPLGFSG